jgi:hypothetical protein
MNIDCFNMCSLITPSNTQAAAIFGFLSSGRHQIIIRPSSGHHQVIIRPSSGQPYLKAAGKSFTLRKVVKSHSFTK